MKTVSAIIFRTTILLIILLVGGCQTDPSDRPAPSVTLTRVIESPEPSATFTPIASPTSTDYPAPPEHTPTPGRMVCSPIKDYTYEDLKTAVSNPFNPPSRPGSDDPHQAVDFAVQQGGMALAGDPVYSVMAGKAAAVIVDRFPYGNALIVEVPLDSDPTGSLGQLTWPTLAPTLGPHPSLTCPAISPQPAWDFNNRSLYLLYAHLQTPVEFGMNDPVGCGQQVGVIGQSGNALHPHVHLEARLGPPGARFPGIAHYDSRASAEEMAYYCAWRVSGTFQLMDPLQILALLP